MCFGETRSAIKKTSYELLEILLSTEEKRWERQNIMVFLATSIWEFKKLAIFELNFNSYPWTAQVVFSLCNLIDYNGIIKQ